MSNTVTVFDIIKGYLVANGFDGLFNDDNGCACELRDLLRCQDYYDDCEPGYKTPCDGPYGDDPNKLWCGGDCGFHISPNREEA